MVWWEWSGSREYPLPSLVSLGIESTNPVPRLKAKKFAARPARSPVHQHMCMCGYKCTWAHVHILADRVS